MPIDTSTWLDTQFPDFTVETTEVMINDFAEAVGHQHTGTPETFPIRLYMDGPQGLQQLQTLGIPVHKVLHAEQGFHYHQAIIAGMQLTAKTRVGNVSHSASGKMIFVTFNIDFYCHNDLVVEMIFGLAVRN